MTVCPFCNVAVDTQICGACGRDITGPRVACRRCSHFVPKADSACGGCGARLRGELAWKIPVIVALFAGAIAINLALTLT